MTGQPASKIRFHHGPDKWGPRCSAKCDHLDGHCPSVLSLPQNHPGGACGRLQRLLGADRQPRQGWCLALPEPKFRNSSGAFPGGRQ